jgi:enediyne biosynthesis protein E4
VSVHSKPPLTPRYGEREIKVVTGRVTHHVALLLWGKRPIFVGQPASAPNLRQALLCLTLCALASQAALGQGLVFEDVSGAAGIDATHRAVWDVYAERAGYLISGQAWGDFDRDGWLDLYLTGNLDDNVLYRNRGDGTFERSPLSDHVGLPGVKSGGATWSDVDNDGWPDLLVVNDGQNALFRNLAGQGFLDVTEAASLHLDQGKSKGAAWGDFDGDGFVDLYLVNWSCIPECVTEDAELSRDVLYRNRGDGTFEDVSHLLDAEKLIGAGFAAIFVDITGNGRLDLFVVNDKVRTPIGNVLWRNDGPGCDGWCWSDISGSSHADTVMHSMGIAHGDYTGDGHIDFYVSNMMSSMVLLTNQGEATFSGNAARAGVAVNPPGEAVGWGTAFIDIDHDGWPDLYLANTGLPFLSRTFFGGRAPDLEDFRHPYPDILFRNLGDGTFEAISYWALDGQFRPTMGLAYADYDRDGHVDLVLGIWNEGYALYRNTGAAAEGHGWLAVELRGAGPVNADAVGSKVLLTTSDGRQQTQHVVNGSSLGAGNSLVLHFGLGVHEVQALTVVWPDGRVQDVEPPGRNRYLKVAYP